jgi:hypothetical protein
MRFLLTLAMAFPIAIAATPAVAQEYWEYEPWETEWELHQPTEGLEYEYEDDYGDYYATDLDEVEAEQYEWEAGEGYHEQEWYDPSDWFEVGRDIDFENDDYWGGYYGDGYYDDDWYYDYYDYR